MKHKRNYLNTFIIISLFCAMFLSNTVQVNAKANWPTARNVNADSAIIMEASTGTILYEKNIDKAQYPASITKIMTTLLAVENCSLNETVTFTQECFYNMESGATHIGATVGENLSMEDALYGVMLASANEVSNAVAIHVAGSVAKFTDMMNERAKELGATNTHFNNPNGLHDKDHYTSARDMALIMQAAMKNQNFRTITGTKRYRIEPTNKCNEVRYLSNHHQMINPTSSPKYGYEYAIGGKTGYTSDAGNTLVTAAKKDGLELICVVLKGKSVMNPENVYTDTISLFDFYFENYSVYNVSEQTSLPTIPDDKLFTKFNSLFNMAEAPVTISGKNTVVLPNTANIKDVVQTITYNNAPVSEDSATVIGQITYTLDNQVVGTNNIIYDKSNMVNKLETASKVVKKKGTTGSLADIFTLSNKQVKKTVLTVLGIVVVIIVILFLTLKVLRNKKRRRYYVSRRKTQNVTNVYNKIKKS